MRPCSASALDGPERPLVDVAILIALAYLSQSFSG